MTFAIPMIRTTLEAQCFTACIPSLLVFGSDRERFLMKPFRPQAHRAVGLVSQGQKQLSRQMEYSSFDFIREGRKVKRGASGCLAALA
jgi:hypothetical protein